MKGFCDRNLHPAGKQAKGHKALDATAWTTKGVLILSYNLDKIALLT